MKNYLVLIGCLLLVACSNADKNVIEKEPTTKIQKPIESSAKAKAVNQPIKRTTSKFDEVCKDHGGTKGCYGLAFECTDGAKIKPAKVSCMDGEYIDDSLEEHAAKELAAKELAARKASNQEIKDKWRENDAQVQQLLSKNDSYSSSSSSYYGSSSSYNSSSRKKSVNVQGYYRKDGTYVRPHKRSSPGSGGKRSRRR